MKKYFACVAMLIAAATCNAARAADIVISQILPISGPIAATGEGLRIGAKAYFDQVNAAGGVHGNKIVLDVLDDQYKGDEMYRLVQKSIAERHPIAIMCLTGSTGIDLILKNEELQKNHIALIGPRAGMQNVRNPVHPFIFHTYSSYWDEIDRIVEVFNSTGVTRFAMLYQDDTFGKDGLAGMEAALKKRNLSLVAEGTYQRGTNDVGAAGDKIMQSNPQAVIFSAMPGPTAEFLKRYREKMPGVQFAGISAIDSGTLVKLAGPKLARGFVISQNMPNPNKSSIAFVREHKKLLAQYAPGVQPNFYTLGGNATAKVIVEALKRAGPKPTREKLIAALETIHDLDIGGILYGYAHEQHLGTRFVELLIIDANGAPQS
jgi:branched-chain amino acid transport system substrate-binding protein